MIARASGESFEEGGFYTGSCVDRRRNIRFVIKK